VNDERAFLNHIWAHPDDETARLVYADWLAEHNDPRHELIRVETAMRRLPVYTEEYHRLKPDRDRLRRVATDDWLALMGYQRAYRPMISALPPTTAERWRLAAEFIDQWHGQPIQPGDGFTDEELDAAEARLGQRLPRALREWYAFAGRRRDVWSRQDRVWEPEYLRRNDHGDLNIRTENQGCTRWYIRSADLGKEDPPVHGGEQDRQVSPTVSAFALLVLVYEAKFTHHSGALEGSDGEEQQEFVAKLGQFPGIEACDLPMWYWFDSPKFFWEAEDVLFEEDPDGWYWIAAQTPAARDRVNAHFNTRLTWYS
jgi:uncharacterized protein (TIGR02996 family)